MREPRSKLVLQEASFILGQQITALRMSAEGHQLILHRRDVDIIFRNALILSFAVSFRNIVDFLLIGRRKPYPDDIIAEDFFHSPEQWSDRHLPNIDLLISHKQRLNKHLAHLTYKMIAPMPEESIWDFERMVFEIVPVLQIFYDNVDPTLIEPSICRELDHQTWNKKFKLFPPKKS